MPKEKSATHGRKDKGSAFWIQTFVNFGEETLEKAITTKDGTISAIKWLSPLKKDNQEKTYEEYSNSKLTEITNIPITGTNGFWPKNGPYWDAVGQAGDQTLVLVEAKAHLTEMNSHCGADNPASIDLIKRTMQETWKEFKEESIPEDDWDNNYMHIWYNRYYQLGNRLSFLNEFNKVGRKTKLVLLNIVNDPTYEPTTQDEWTDHYEGVFKEMLGKTNPPENVIIINIDVG